MEVEQLGSHRTEDTRTDNTGLPETGRRCGGIGVVMCTYNGETFVREQLDSIAAQTRLPHSLVVVDDGSTDRTVEVVQSFALDASFPIRIVANPTNLGWVRNFDKAIRLAEGDVIVLSDQDDVWRADKLEKMAAALAGSAAPGLVFSDAELVDAELRPLGRSLWEGIRFTRARQHDLLEGKGFERLLRYCYVTGATLAFRTEFRDLVLPIPAETPHDAWIALLIAAVDEIGFIAEPLVRYRQHGHNQIGVRYRSRMQLLTDQQTRNTEVLRVSLERARLARGRLAENPLVSRRKRRILDETIRHLSVRTELPKSRVARLRPVAGELLAGRYRGPLGGVPSAARDLLL